MNIMYSVSILFLSFTTLLLQALAKHRVCCDSLHMHSLNKIFEWWWFYKYEGDTLCNLDFDEV